MKQFVNNFVSNRLSRLRICALIALSAIACGMLITQSGSQGTQPALVGWRRGELSGFNVTLDPGHGGYDGGARARDSGIWEKDLTLLIALETEKALKARGAEVTLTRREDICLCKGNTATKQRKRQDLQARVDAALEAQADVLLSIHLNEYRSRSESGPQVFYERGGEDGKLLAQTLQKALVEGLKPPKVRVAMAGDYYVLRSKIPSALVECGFLSNPDEEKLLLDGEYHKRIAESIAEGLCAYREMLKNGDAAASAEPLPYR